MNPILLPDTSIATNWLAFVVVVAITTLLLLSRLTVTPLIPGSPSTPDFPLPFRIVHALISVLIGVTGSLGTALISVNLPAIQGSLGLTPTQGAWLTTVYIMTNISMNLLLVKYRQQFGIRRFALVFLSLYTVAAFAHLALDNFAMALVLRAISGVGAAVANAVYNASGVRVRDFPITLDKVLAGWEA